MIVFNKKRFLEGVAKGVFDFSNASKALRDDDEVAIFCAKHGKGNVVYPNLSRRLKNNPDFLLELLSTNGLELKNIYKYRDDKEFVERAVCSNKDAFNYASKSLKQDKDYLLNLVSKNAFVYKELEFGFDQDEDIARTAISTNALVYKDIHKDFKEREDLALLAVAGNSYTYNFLSPTLKENKQVIFTALNQADAFTYYLYKDKIPEKLREDEKVALCACQNQINCIKDIPTNLFRKNDFQLKLITYIEETSEQMMATNNEEDILSAREFESYAKKLFLERRDSLMEEINAQNAQEVFEMCSDYQDVVWMTGSIYYEE